MKKLITALLVAAMTVALIIPASAVTPVPGIEHCYFEYICNQSALPVTTDGTVADGEWDDATELVINNDTIEDYGRWQSANSLPASDLSCTYKFKWDADNFYLLEIRTDSSYVSDFAGNDYGALNPWMLDGTALFFCDNDDPTTANRCDIKWYSYVDELKAPAVYIGNGDGTGFSGASGEDGVTYGGKVSGDTITFELKMPWAVMDDLGYLSSDIAEGTIFRFTPIIMTRDTVDDYAAWDGSSYAQINFHDCINVADEDANGAENPEYWAALKLGAVNYTAPTTETPAETPAETPTETPADTAPSTPADTTAPQTADMGIIAALAVLAIASGAVLTIKKNK